MQITSTPHPIQYTIETIQDETKLWHDYIKIYYVLSGSINININDQMHHLEADDLILINQYQTHILNGYDCKTATFQVHLNRFNNPLFFEQNRQFDCNSTTLTNPSDLTIIKQLLASIVKNSESRISSDSLLNYAYTYELMHHLYTSYSVISSTPSTNTNTMRRFGEIINFLNIHYMEKLTLKDIAEQFYLSVPYLSKTFKDHMGVGFKAYLNRIRLNYAMTDIGDSSIPIHTIALKHGFSNASAFVHVFKAEHLMLPSDYRKQTTPISSTSNLNNTSQRSLGSLHNNDLGPLAKYLDRTSNALSESTVTPRIFEVAPIAMDQKAHKLKHTFRHMTTISKAKQILFAQNQAMLKTLQKDISFNYIRFHGLFDDEMMVYTEDENGKPQICFTYVDMVLDFLLSIQLKPFMQLTYMPSALALTPERTAYHDPSIVSLPKDYEKWSHLVDELIGHLETRYGKSQVESWPFSLWNEPDSPVSIFGFEDPNDYYEFYEITYKVVKKRNPKILFGAPSLMTPTIEDGQWVNDFLTFCHKHHCEPAFLNYHYYPNILDIHTKLDKNLIAQPRLMVQPSENAFGNSIDTVKENAKKFNWSMDDIYISEWNLSISHRELLNDTAFKAPYIVKNILENYDQMKSFGYWTLTDFMEEVKMSKNLYHGGMGLFTYNGIKKAAYFAFTLLGRLGDYLIDQGVGYFVTRKDTSYQIILYNYVHFSLLYASGELFDTTFTNRYTPFPNASRLKFILPLKEMTSMDYIITDTLMNRAHGSSFDKWVELGAMPLETSEEIDYIKSVSVPKISKQLEHSKNNTLTISRLLEPHEVRLIEIHPRV